MIETINNLIDKIISDPDSEPYVYKFEEPIDLRKVVAETRILPLMYDWSGFYGIRPCEIIVFVDFNEGPPFEIKSEEDPRICRMALFQGSRRYAELSKLAPTRPADALDCRSCGGSGREPTNDKRNFGDDRIVCWCGGLGWVASGEYQP